MTKRDFNADESNRSREQGGLSEEIFSGQGAPALMSPKEPAIRLLRERYGESFAFTPGTNGRVHLFLIKIGLWSLVWTFVSRDSIVSKAEQIKSAMAAVSEALFGKIESQKFLQDLDSAVSKSKARIEEKSKEFRAFTKKKD